MNKTFGIRSIFDVLNLGSLNASNPIENLDSFFLNSSKEKESANSLPEAKNANSLFKQLMAFYSFEEVQVPSGKKDKQHTTEHNVERFQFHSHRNRDTSSIIPQTVRVPSFIEEKERMLAKIRSCYFEAGILCEADYYFMELVKKQGSIEYPLSLLSEITNHNIDNEHVLEGVLHILSNCDYSAINPIGISIVLAAAVNHSPVIQDLLISCFESWDAEEGIDILEKVKLDTPWIDQYRNEVVSQLKKNHLSA